MVSIAVAPELLEHRKAYYDELDTEFQSLVRKMGYITLQMATTLAEIFKLENPEIINAEQ